MRTRFISPKFSQISSYTAQMSPSTMPTDQNKAKTLLKELLGRTTQPSFDDLGDSTSCPICQEPYLTPDSPELPLKLSCGHIAGSQCLLKWMSLLSRTKKNSCPVCRADILKRPTNVFVPPARIAHLSPEDTLFILRNNQRIIESEQHRLGDRLYAPFGSHLASEQRLADHRMLLHRERQFTFGQRRSDCPVSRPQPEAVHLNHIADGEGTSRTQPHTVTQSRATGDEVPFWARRRISPITDLLHEQSQGVEGQRLTNTNRGVDEMDIS